MYDSIFNACAVIEGFDDEEHTEEEQLEAWQYIYDSGAYKSLQGFYGRGVDKLLKMGKIA